MTRDGAQDLKATAVKRSMSARPSVTGTISTEFRPQRTRRLARLPPSSPGLPPGQSEVPGFPHFGSLWSPRATRSRTAPAILVSGLVDQAFEISFSQLGQLRRRRLTADFHCVAGWSSRDLRWGGVPFRLFYDTLIAPRVRPGERITHLLLIGADGWKADVRLDDARAANTVLADHLDRAPLTQEHGGPLRFVSPAQYGYKSVKYLARIELHDHDPNDLPGRLGPRLALSIVRAHPRARVAFEERHRYLPSWILRWPYRNLAYPFLAGLLSLEDALQSRNGRG